MNTHTPHQGIAPSAFRQILAALAVTGMTSHAALLVNEGFSNYSDGALNGQSASGTGLTGNWSGGTPIQRQSSGLTMNGVFSSPGSAVIRSDNNTAYKVTAQLQSPLSTGQLYGSYLFSTTVQNDARSVGVIAAGGETDDDTAASFAWAGNGYFNASGASAVEGPGVRVEGSGWLASSAALNAGETYLMVFEFNASTSTTTAWVLNQSQLSHHTANAFTGIALNLATLGTAADQVAWKGSATRATTPGVMSHLHLIGLARSSGFVFTWDEFRVSDTSLLEAVTVPEPSALAFGLAAAALVTGRRRRTF